MILPSLLVYVVSRMARMSPPLRASNEGLLRPRVARAQGTYRAIPPLVVGFFSIVLKIPTAFDRLQQRHFVGILDIHPDRNAIGDTRDPGPERFQLVR
jgi:hypothetical protein